MSPDRRSNLACDAAALLAIMLLAFNRWTLLGPFPPGLDGAHWIATGRGFQGVGRASEGFYPPLIPALAAAANTLLGNPLAATRAVATGACLLLSLAIWIVPRAAMGPYWALSIAAIVLPASALAEPLMYGGYPQQIALAANVVALWAICCFLFSGTSQTLWIAGIGGLISALAHHIYFPLFLISVVVAMAFSRAFLSPESCRARWSRVFWALMPAGLSLGFIAARMRAAGYSAPLGATSLSIVEAWTYATREAPLLWFLIFVVGTAGLAWTWQSSNDPFWLLAASLLAPAAFLAIATGQTRLLSPVLIGSVFGLGLAARRLTNRGVPLRLIALASMPALAALLLVPAQRAALEFADFYRVVSASMVNAANAIVEDAQSGAVAARSDRRGWPVGWWIEALQTSPVYVGSDEKWLAFPDERTRSEQAMALFDGGLSPDELRNRATDMDVRYLIAPKWDWIGWERWAVEPASPVQAIFDDDRYVVFRIQ